MLRDDDVFPIGRVAGRLAALARNRPAALAPREAVPAATGPALPAAPSDAARPHLHETRRRKIWELESALHCSIVGTCLSAGELRQILARLDIAIDETASDHDLHGRGVVAARSRQGGGKPLNKALDRRHHVAINQFAKARTDAAVGALWTDAVRRGDIPGAYWAVLTHPATSEALRRKVFGEVHMLSHLVGAANRADIRRLHQLEQENAALAAKVERQQAARRHRVARGEAPRTRGGAVGTDRGRCRRQTAERNAGRCTRRSRRRAGATAGGRDRATRTDRTPPGAEPGRSRAGGGGKPPSPR
jgi:hypothetical protein